MSLPLAADPCQSAGRRRPLGAVDVPVVPFSWLVTRRDGIEYHLWRQTLSDGEVTTLYAVRHPS
jgi:hypothetical protein